MKPNDLILSSLSSNYDECYRELRGFASTHCTDPVFMYVPDPFTGKLMRQYYDCGKCDHCRNVKANQFATRIELDSRIQGHLYFVTLTYTSVYITKNSIHGYFDHSNDYQSPSFIRYNISDAVLNLLKKNILHYDNLNTHHRYCYTTCLPDLNDYSGFLKRLRVNTNAFCQSFAVSEFGHKNAHPHIHALISSDRAISLAEFRSAWSLRGCPIGTCYVSDLVANGTLSNVAGSTAKKCVAYVAKYMDKSSDFNTTRLKFAYYLYRAQFTPYKRYNLNKFLYVPNFVTIHKLYTHFVKPLNSHQDETTLFSIHRNGSKNVWVEVPSYLSRCYQFHFPKFKLFCRYFCKPARYSTRNAFGSLYLRSNLERLASGNKRLSIEPGSSNSYPSFFERKVRQYLFPISFYKYYSHGSSSVGNNIASVVYNNLSQLPKNYADYSKMFDSLSAHSLKCKNLSCSQVLSFFREHIYIINTKEHLNYNPSNQLFESYTYDRSSKSYVFNGAVYSIDDMISKFKDQFARYKDYYYTNYSNKRAKVAIYDYCLNTELGNRIWNECVSSEKVLWDRVKGRTIENICINKYNYL